MTPSLNHAADPWIDDDDYDPHNIGFRYRPVILPDGSEDVEMVPLTEDDLMHPIEGDKLLTPEIHVYLLQYLQNAFRARLTQLRPRTQVFCDHGIDWQIEGIQVVSPDITVAFDTDFFSDEDAIYPVRDMGASTPLIIEVTSPGTRKKDLGPKVDLYWRARVQMYLVLDLPSRKKRRQARFVVHEWSADGWVTNITQNEVWLPAVQLWFVIENDDYYLRDPEGRRVPDFSKLTEQLQAEKQKLEEERQRADAEKKIAQQEKQRADALAAELSQLKARFSQSSSNGHHS